uniref:Coiled-coil serine rich protein 2 n=1 Tax=Sphenodon punctatus TaxID=8508 RepID=A0A8D0GBK1_SPHPU
MEEKPPIRTSLGSRLPKYGTKPVGNSLQAIPNGTALNLSGNKNSAKNCSKHNGTVRMSSFSFNWRKSNKYQLGDQSGKESSTAYISDEKLVHSEKYSPSQGAVGKDVLRVDLSSNSSVSSKTAKQANMFVSSMEELNQKSFPGLSSSTKFTKGTLLGRTSYPGLTTPKSHLNGFYGKRSTVSLQRSRASSGATKSSLGDSQVQSTDNVKSFSCEKMVRSQSFSHSIQNSFLPPASLTRSHSFNRAVDLTRPYQNQHLAIRAPQRSNLLLRNVRQMDIPNANEPLRYGFTRPYAAMTSSGLKKPPLSNGSGAAPTFGYQIGRPSLLKPSRQHFGNKIIIDGSKSKTTDVCVVEDPRTEGGEVLLDNLGENVSNIMCVTHDVDEISISSLSSSEKNDLSEDFSDDFIDLEDPNRTIQAEQEDIPVQDLEPDSSTQVDLFLSLKESDRSHCNSEEWLDVPVSVGEKRESTKHLSGSNLISSDMDYRAGSSFELSPSDSSDGTYMWDEEGLEPIGSVHPCGSYESSEMNSIDILNNLDSCDLEDDDLMLDVDLPEDTPCDNAEFENMNHYDRADRNVRQHQEGLWKRTPQRWSAQDHYRLGRPDHYPHGKNDLNRTPLCLEPNIGHFEGCGVPNFYQGPRPMMGLPENTVMLDEMTLRHMVQDCTAVKTQLLKLKRLLHQNDENASLQDIPFSIPSSPEAQDTDTIYKTEDLLNEITQLKEELKKKDETIKQLEHQLVNGQNSKGAVCTHADKYTQTAWRKSSPQVLQPSSSHPSSTDLAQGKLTKMPHIEAHSEYTKQSPHVNGEQQNLNAANGSITNSLNELNALLSTQLNIKDLDENTPSENVKVKENTKESGQMTIQTKLAVKSQPSLTNQASRPKTSRTAKPPSQSALVPPVVALTASSLDGSRTSKEPQLPPPSCPTQLQPISSQANLKSKQTQQISKLRPPTISFKTKQISNLKSTLISPEPQNTKPKTNLPRPLAQRKENMQNQNIGLHAGDSLASNQHSRLPKPKTH